MVDILPVTGTFERWDDLLMLITTAFASMNGVIDPPSSALALTPQSLKNKAADEIAYMAVQDGILLGCLFCRLEPPDGLYIGKLAVAPVAQGKGIGRALLAHAEVLARNEGLKKLRLETRIELTGNHRTFQSWGFEKTADRCHPGYDRVTFIEMAKPLS